MIGEHFTAEENLDFLAGRPSLEAIRERCELNFAFFLSFLYDPNYLESFHGDLARWLQEHVPTDTRKDRARLRVTLPRGFLKTSIVTKMFSLWLYLVDQETRVCISSNTDKNAEKYS